MENFDRSFLLGIVLDLENSSNLNKAKEILIKFLISQERTSNLNIWIPDLDVEMPRDQGQAVFCITSYQGVKNIATAFKKTVSQVGEYNDNCEKYVLLITDKFQAPMTHFYRKGFMMNSVRNYDCKIQVFSLGSVDDVGLNSITEDYDSLHVKLNNISELEFQLNKILEDK